MPRVLESFTNRARSSFILRSNSHDCNWRTWEDFHLFEFRVCCFKHKFQGESNTESYLVYKTVIRIKLLGWNEICSVHKVFGSSLLDIELVWMWYWTNTPSQKTVILPRMYFRNLKCQAVVLQKMLLFLWSIHILLSFVMAMEILLFTCFSDTYLKTFRRWYRHWKDDFATYLAAKQCLASFL